MLLTTWNFGKNQETEQFSYVLNVYSKTFAKRHFQESVSLNL